jgi:transposase InsO family protein
VTAAEERAAPESQASVTCDERTWVVDSLATPARKMEQRVGPRGSSRTESGLAVRHDESVGGANVCRAYQVEVIDCCTREIVGWNLSHRCRTEDALAAVKQAVLERLPEASREARWTMTTDSRTQFISTRFIETLNPLGITHRRTAYHHPEGNSYIERFHRSLNDEEVLTAEYRS